MQEQSTTNYFHWGKKKGPKRPHSKKMFPVNLLFLKIGLQIGIGNEPVFFVRRDRGIIRWFFIFHPLFFAAHVLLVPVRLFQAFLPWQAHHDRVTLKAVSSGRLEFPVFLENFVALAVFFLNTISFSIRSKSEGGFFNVVGL